MGLRAWAGRMKGELVALHHAAQDPRTPRSARIVAALTLAYALSPIDLIPDFIPVLGLLDDVVLVPLGLFIAARLIPREILAEHRARAAAGERLPRSRLGGAIVVSLWCLSALGVAYVLLA